MQGRLSKTLPALVLCSLRLHESMNTRICLGRDCRSAAPSRLSSVLRVPLGVMYIQYSA